MFQSKIFSYKFNSFHDEERREGALGFKITSIQEEKGEEEGAAVPHTPKMETRRKFGLVDPSTIPEMHVGATRAAAPDDDASSPEFDATAPLERQDSEISTLSAFSEVDLDEFYVELDSLSAEEEEEEEEGMVRGMEAVFTRASMSCPTKVSSCIDFKHTL